jgi:uncharacterized protein
MAPTTHDRTARRGVALGLAVLMLAALLNAESLEHTASTQPFGTRRDVAVAVAEPLAALSRTVGLTQPRRWVEQALHRSHPGGTRPTPVTTTVPAASTTSTTAPGPSTSTTLPPPPTAEDPVVVWVAGDSMMQTLGRSIVDQAEATGVIETRLDARVSTGLTRPDYFDWFATAAQVLADDRPEAVIVTFGANDAQGIETPTGPEPFGTEAWKAEYRGRVTVMMDLLVDGGVEVYWVGQPVMRSADFSARMAALNEIYRDEASRRPAVRFVDTWPILATSDGSYTAYLTADDGSTVRVRLDDGIHLTSAGADRVATAVLAPLLSDFGIAEEIR